MCQATVFLDGEEIMQDVVLVEPVQDGVRMSTFFEEPDLVPAVIRRIDLLKHQVLLESISPDEEQK